MNTMTKIEFSGAVTIDSCPVLRSKILYFIRHSDFFLCKAEDNALR